MGLWAISCVYIVCAIKTNNFRRINPMEMYVNIYRWCIYTHTQVSIWYARVICSSITVYTLTLSVTCSSRRSRWDNQILWMPNSSGEPVCWEANNHSILFLFVFSWVYMEDRRSRINWSTSSLMMSWSSIIFIWPQSGYSLQSICHYLAISLILFFPDRDLLQITSCVSNVYNIARQVNEIVIFPSV